MHIVIEKNFRLAQIQSLHFKYSNKYLLSGDSNQFSGEENPVY